MFYESYRRICHFFLLMKWRTEGFGLVQYLCLKMVSLYSAAPLNIFLKGHMIRNLLTVLTVVSAFGLAVGREGETFAGFRLFTQEFNASSDELPNDFGWVSTFELVLDFELVL